MLSPGEIIYFLSFYLQLVDKNSQEGERVEKEGKNERAGAEMKEKGEEKKENKREKRRPVAFPPCCYVTASYCITHCTSAAFPKSLCIGNDSLDSKQEEKHKPRKHLW